ncbi:CRISPR-associated endonuclease Cas2 [Caldisericum sp.]|uniref:CRISPR-associated endonuclease Cas2 n=1 Tax=Caldisericum sp. TaxID=2499687 RepID=UPI003D0C0020
MTEAKFEKFKRELNDIIEKDKDSIIFYILREQYYAKKEILGVVKNDLDNIL